MAKVVTALSMSHAPGVLGWPDAPSQEMKDSVAAAHAECARRLQEAKPDVIIAFLDDHFENHFRNLMPTFAVGIAQTHSGPADYMMEALKFDKKAVIDGQPELGEAMLRGLVGLGFDVARMGEIEYGNNLLVPLKFLTPNFDVPVLPLYINVFSPPLPTMNRAYDFGVAVRKIVDGLPSDLRVAFLATGGLSHWPPVWTEGAPEDDEFLMRMKRYQTEGRQVALEDPSLYSDLASYEIEMASKMQWPLRIQHPLVNAHWDREIIEAFAKGDAEKLRGMTYEEVEEGGGHGGHEILNWVAVMGAMGGAPAHIVGYEPVMEWICGMGYIAYDPPLAQAA
ncbi:MULTISPECIES: extradiol dioxygenase [unclassified Hyphomicrobium]|uniref:DODA-type extradiol aromatic ring-opening family dioxygenase n=1 Tax=unclassified Hyphomicrobium TaxID=2619925 RepID=UPI000213F846|nr:MULTISPECIES: extradiol dioxygenase [unclassified Hyphomicrobium]CCB63417.1 PydA [Hyphomicrobium sp. MC1]